MGALSYALFLDKEITYSEPTYENGSKINWTEPTPKPDFNTCLREEWNQMFKDYREDKISKDSMVKYVGECGWQVE